ncbi:hypothetical protein [Paraliomyxa miuraensis]|uniref:hypothetical protein n=1 Tax=Paraliomyxa miuraensis TaxID=376150 RepID=UPI002250A4C7|nr:hypothetical protein [Paraliomyxa miuraensis]MCX4245292.1 hypothetical protein [Paraliomyxa miuraensis]
MNRTFIAFACTLLLACPGSDDASDTTVADSGTADATGTGTSTGGTETGQTSEPTSVGSADGTSSTGPSTAPGEGSGSATGTGPDPLGVCMTACEHLVACELVMIPNCGIPCATIDSDVAGCESEYIAQQECVTALSCDEAQAWLEGDMLGGSYPCADEDVEFQACLQAS